MTATGPILRDIHVPSVPWWPPALGWWLLVALVLMAVVVGALLTARHRRRVQPRYAARRELDSFAAQYARDRDLHALAARLSQLLRRIALMIEPDAAASDSTAWRVFLEHRAPGAFDNEQLIALLDAPYRAHSVFDAEALLASTRNWCERALRKGVRPPA